MSAPFEPVTVVEEFVHQTLAGDAELDALLGPDNIWPAFGPAEVTGMHLVHDYSGPDGGNVATPIGGAPAMLTLLWDVTAWTPGMDRQVLRAVAKRVQALLCGPELTGQWCTFTSTDTSVWSIGCRYRGPVVVPADINPTWQRVCARFAIELRPHAA